MTEEQVVNVRGEVSDSVTDHRSVKANGVAHGVGGDLDLAADNNGAALSEKICKDAVSNGTAEEVSETAMVNVVSRDDELKCADGQNDTGSVQNGVVENDDKSANAVAEELVTDHDEYVVVGDSDVQNGDDVNANANGVEECEMLDGAEGSGDENGVVVSAVEGDADVNHSDREFECVDVHNDVAVETVEEEVTATTDQNVGNGNDVQGRSESVSDEDVDKSGESVNVVSADVLDEKDIVTDGDHDAEEVLEKNEILVDADGVSATTDLKQCEPEDARNSSEKGQVESVSGLAKPEPSECTEENEIAVEGEPGSKLERSEEEAGSEIVPQGENLTALNSTDVTGDGDVVSDIAVESKDEPSVDVCELKSIAVENDVDVQELKNGAVQSEIVSEMKNNTEESVAEPSNGAVESEAEPSNGAVESEADPSNGAVEWETEHSNGAVERETEHSNGAVESVAEPSNGAVESVAEPSNSAVDREDEPSNGAVDKEAEPSNGAVDKEAEPSNGAVDKEAEPSNGTVEREAEPSNGAVQSEAEPSNGAVGSVAEPSNGAVGSVAEPSNVAVESETDPSNGALESETDPSNGAVDSEAEPSNGAVDKEAEPSKGTVESEAGPSNGAVESEAEPSNGAVESEAEPSNGAVRCVAEPSNGAVESEAEPSNGAVAREAKPSNGAVESEAEPSQGAVDSEAEPSNGAVESEVKPSQGAVESEAEPSQDAVESEAELSNGAVNREAETASGAVESEAKTSSGAVETEVKPSHGVVESEAKPSNGVAESESEPSVDVCETKNDVVNSEAETSSGALQSEREACVVSEMKNNAVESEAQPSVDVSEKKTNAVDSEAELSVKGGLSVESEGSNQGDEDSRPASDALDGQNVGTEVVKKPFYYLIRVPRYDDDENIKEKIKNALHQVEEKTKIRDAIRIESQTIKASCKDFDQEFRAAIAAHRAARDLLKSKRQEIDSVQSTMNRLNNAISVGDIDDKIRSMEHMIQHETLPLNKEKQLIREIKQLKQNREELSSNMKKQDQSQQSVDNKDDNIEEHFKHLQLLKKEMEVLRNNVLKSDTETKAAKKKYNDECDKLNELLARFRAADDSRQEAYAKLLALKKQLHEKSKNFWEYRDAANKAQELAAGGKKEELQCFCVDQVERIMELWNKNDGFRRDYVRCNTRSTLRRLQTLDGRSLGPDEEPPVIPNVITERASKNIPMVLQSTLEQEKKSTPTESVNVKDEPVSKVVVQRTETSQTTKAKKPTKPAPLEKHVARWGDESDEDEVKKEEPVRTKEEEELILKAEKARMEEEEAKLKEKRRLEEIEKAKEALLRKKRNAEKAQQRAALKAQKEAELKEKEREKRAKKKERRKAGSAVTAENTEQESAPIPETLTRSVEEFEQTEKTAEVTKKPQKTSQFTRQTKVKSVPAALRNRGKRRIQPWVCVLIALVVAVALFYVGHNCSLRSSLEGFGY
ncbi:hypothetical protein GLYMA_20G006500v4 [Glycine max]|nr:hypothetical protein GYH30_054378 [Glycine max]KRG89177.2 hypothetical protein GLYMA_20G006500v4 [Glycine max]